jgi:hypothetical protein
MEWSRTLASSRATGYRGVAMGEDPAKRRDARAEQADYHVAAQRRREEHESAKAQVLVDRFVARAKEAGVPTEELTARPWSGRGRYRTGVVGWYLRPDRSVGVGLDGRYYVLVVEPQRFGRWRTVPLEPTPPPLQVGKGARDGESIALDALLERRLSGSTSPLD